MPAELPRCQWKKQASIHSMQAGFENSIKIRYLMRADLIKAVVDILLLHSSISPRQNLFSICIMSLIAKGHQCMTRKMFR